MKMFLTRIGRNCKMMINGDVTQSDLKCPSGLEDALDRLVGHPDIGIIEFTEDDIVRSGIVKDILKRYSSESTSCKCR
jgi:phosphate starvation-inducible PhoH-like protein